MAKLSRPTRGVEAALNPRLRQRTSRVRDFRSVTAADRMLLACPGLRPRQPANHSSPSLRPRQKPLASEARIPRSRHLAEPLVRPAAPARPLQSAGRETWASTVSAVDENPRPRVRSGNPNERRHPDCDPLRRPRGPALPPLPAALKPRPRSDRARGGAERHVACEAPVATTSQRIRRAGAAPVALEPAKARRRASSSGSQGPVRGGAAGATPGVGSPKSVR